MISRKFIFLFFYVLLIPQIAKAGTEWKQLTDGLQYKKISIEQQTNPDVPSSVGYIHLFLIDPLKYKLNVVTAKQLGLLNADAKTFAQKSGAILAINGGFFTPEFDSLGLLAQNGKEINPIKGISWWHVFRVKKGIPEIITKTEYQLSPDTEMAIEAGPRLLVEGQIPKLKPSADERSAIGITADKKIIIAASESILLSLTSFATYLSQNGCINALNLDGGSSTQLYAKLGQFQLNVQNIGLVANAVGLFSK